MASSIPSQIRTVDPFASFNSDTVNALTRMITRGNDGISSPKSLDVIADTTSATDHVVVTPGIIFKDDVLIRITANHRVDFTDEDHYVSFGAGFNEAGYYYVVLEYTFQKSRPAPEARIKILKPSQLPHASLGTSLFFLKAVRVTFNGVSFEISSLHDADPTDPTVEREYTPLYFGVEVTLPTHDGDADVGRVVYETSTDTFWFGFSDRWDKISAGVETNIDTTGTFVGALCYTDSDGAAVLASPDDINTGAEIAVSAVGLEVDRSGRAILAGFVEGVRVENGIVINTGDLLYLSSANHGRVTNVKSSPYQVVGRALSGGNQNIPINILFFPRDVLAFAIQGQITPSDWVYDGGRDLWVEELDISGLDTTGAVLSEYYDDSDGSWISPSSQEIISNDTILRVWMPDGTHTLNYIISAGGGGASGTGGGGGGGGVTQHSLLLQLDYASSGHTGFAPSPHNNAHHSDTYITASGVTYANLNANGDVGTGAVQVARGNHTHGTFDWTTGFFTRTKFEYVGVGRITLEGARYHHNGTSEQIVEWDNDITYDFGPLGSNAGSSSMASNQWHYLYLDDSAIVLAGTSTITASELINSTTAPVWVPSKLGWYNSLDRCIGAFRTQSGSGNLRIFWHDGDRLIQWDAYINQYQGNPGSGWAQTVSLYIPAFSIKGLVTFDNYTNGCTGSISTRWRPQGSSGNGHYTGRHVGSCSGDDHRTWSANQMVVHTNSSGQIELYASSSDANTQLGVFQDGYYLGKGL
jgi:hypothetical protein